MNCKDCVHYWRYKTEDERIAHVINGGDNLEDGWGLCKKMNGGGDVASDETSLAYAQDFEHWGAVVNVSESFGCIMFESQANTSDLKGVT